MEPPTTAVCEVCGKPTKKSCACKCASYCSKECQRSAWAEHKQICLARTKPESRTATPGTTSIADPLAHMKTAWRQVLNLDRKKFTVHLLTMLMQGDFSNVVSLGVRYATQREFANWRMYAAIGIAALLCKDWKAAEGHLGLFAANCPSGSLEERIAELRDIGYHAKFLCHKLCGDDVAAEGVLQSFNPATHLFLRRDVSVQMQYLRARVKRERVELPMNDAEQWFSGIVQPQQAQVAWEYLRRPLQDRSRHETFHSQQQLRKYLQLEREAVSLSDFGPADHARYSQQTAGMLVIQGAFRSGVMQFDEQMAICLSMPTAHPAPVPPDEILLWDVNGAIERSDVVDTAHGRRWIRYVANADLNATRAKELIAEFIEAPLEQLFVVYCGHGERNSGNWIMSDESKVCYSDLEAILRDKSGKRSLSITLNCCYGKLWRSLEQDNVHIVASEQDEVPEFMGIYMGSYDASLLVSYRAVFEAMAASHNIDSTQLSTLDILAALTATIDSSERAGRSSLPEEPKQLLPFLEQIERLRGPVYRGDHPLGFPDRDAYVKFLDEFYDGMRQVHTHIEVDDIEEFKIVFQGSSVQGFSWKCKPGRDNRLFCHESDYDIAIISWALAQHYKPDLYDDARNLPGDDALEILRSRMARVAGRSVSFLLVDNEVTVFSSGKASFVQSLDAEKEYTGFLLTLGRAKQVKPSFRCL